MLCNATENSRLIKQQTHLIDVLYCDKKLTYLFYLFIYFLWINALCVSKLSFFINVITTVYI